MSVKNAEQFLKDALHNPELRAAFEDAKTPQDFFQISESLGYDFSSQDLETVISQHSQGVQIRRRTGIWHWLRTVNWIDRQEAQSQSTP
ncbi:MAG: Nif11-like leader peptide family natural product precursor [Sodalinema sp.]|uniref:Nif11-like leader peptide family natural product precursor n=1 Tax=Sodalinema sp. TaxID=3080550 RepID=UPI00120BA33A|nr:MAG: Nif11-like leader peptide family natural product precursor [Phormidium sp. SL48-SHIP]